MSASGTLSVALFLTNVVILDWRPSGVTALGTEPCDQGHQAP